MTSFRSGLNQKNRAYAQVHTPLPFISERASWGVAPPKTFIVTCMDARVIPEVFLKLEYGGMSLICASTD